MRNRIYRLFTAIAVIVAMLLPIGAVGLAQAQTVSARDSWTQCFVFEARGHAIPVTQAIGAVQTWAAAQQPGAAAATSILRENHQLGDDTDLATGDLVSISIDGKPASTYGVVVRGDALGTGRPGISQLTLLAKILRGGSTSTLQGAAADLDGSGAVGLADLVRAASYFSHPDPGGPLLADAPQVIVPDAEALAPAPEDSFRLQDVPAYSGEAYAAVHGNVPYFPLEGNPAQSWENYSGLDDLRRCGPASATIGQDIMPSSSREPIGEVHPTGWQSAKYPGIVPGGYLYNRCHLIGYQLSAENANPYNLITGTRYLNVQGMLPFENMVADYVKETGNHVLYRATPIFLGDELVARGVLLEAASVEDNGEDLLFCVFVYNVQPGIEIDYATGLSQLSGESEPRPEPTGGTMYVLSLNTHKFHRPDCSTANRLKPENRGEFIGSREDVCAMGYEPCGICRP